VAGRVPVVPVVTAGGCDGPARGHGQSEAHGEDRRYAETPVTVCAHG
jgi:hypothetical protein